MTESLVQNKTSSWSKLKVKFKANNSFRIGAMMLIYWALINIILLSLVNLNSYWQIISGFNLGFFGGFIGFLILVIASKWLFSKHTLKQVFAYFTFLVRIVIYGLVVALAIVFSFFNLFGIIGGFSLLVLGTLTSEIFNKRKWAKVKC